MTEEWRSIPGYEGIYEASSLGRIRTAKGKQTWSSRSNCWRTWEQRIIKQKVRKAKNRNRYDARVILYKDGIEKTFLVARLVASAFYGSHDDLTVNHIDGNSLNNEASNLEWVTMNENIKLANDTGLMDWCKTPIKIENTETGVIKSFRSMREASEYLGKFKGYISQKIKRGQDLSPPYRLLDVGLTGGG